MSERSEGEVHVQAMRLTCEALEDREEGGLEVDWDVINQQLDHMDTILQGIADQRRDDAEEIQTLKKERDAAEAEVSKLMKQLADAQRAASDEFTERQVLTVEQQQDAAAWQQQVDSANAEVKYLRDRLNEARSVNVDLQGKLDAARSDNVEIRRRLAEETDRHRATNAEKIDLFQKLQWANQHAAELVKERDAAHMTILAQKRGNQFLRLLIDKVRGIVNRDDAMSERLEEIALAIHEFDHGTLEPAPETEPAPCPECERWQRAKRIDSELVASKAKEIERLQAFVGKVRSVMDREYDGVEFDDLSRALAEFDANSSATLTSSVVKESLTPAAEEGQ